MVQIAAFKTKLVQNIKPGIHNIQIQRVSNGSKRATTYQFLDKQKIGSSIQTRSQSKIPREQTAE